MSIANYIFIEDESHGHAFPVADENIPLNYTLFQNVKIASTCTLVRVKLLVHCLYMYTSTFYLTIQGILLVLTLSLRKLGDEFAAEMKKNRGIPDEAIEKVSIKRCPHIY